MTEIASMPEARPPSTVELIDQRLSEITMDASQVVLYSENPAVHGRKYTVHDRPNLAGRHPVGESRFVKSHSSQPDHSVRVTSASAEAENPLRNVLDKTHGEHLGKLPKVKHIVTWQDTTDAWQGRVVIVGEDQERPMIVPFTIETITGIAGDMLPYADLGSFITDQTRPLDADHQREFLNWLNDLL